MKAVEIIELAVNAIAPDPAQPRKILDQQAVESLAASIREVGVLVPLRVRRVGESYLLEDGERRWTAAKLAERATVPCVVDAEASLDAEILQRQLICNCQREDLTALEKAAGIDRLMNETGWNALTVSKKLGMSSASISKLLSLLVLPDPIRAKVNAGEIAPSAAYDLARIIDPLKQAELANELAEGRLTRDELSGRIKSERRTAPETGAQVARGRINLGGERSITVAGPELSLERLIDWLEELLGKARKARTQGLELATLIKVINDQSKPRPEAA